eukprot:TRINITY_DN34610_c0_g1_i2.p1 TRINITY_DN34610_c0_g1~~TRINITY_DN34610_c0_g1_i2.p1  ORF type:complete len:584 (+),score=79.16 TRINITY_DN34610_c0_g1_i2:55-1752(+)
MAASSPRTAVGASVPEDRYDVDVEACYKLDNTIGQGGFSTVVVARDRRFEDRVVAVKRMVKKSPRQVDALHREVELMRDLDHPHICKLFELFEDSKHMFLVMELCAGGELLDRIIANQFMSESIVADILDQVVHALRYAHGRKIAHRDLKPENVCFCSKDATDTSVKVIDWGLGAIFGQESMSNAVGTLMYSAPEVLCYEHRMETGTRDGAYGCACDLWSIGVLAYVMLSGRPPFWGSKQAMIDNIRKAAYPMNFAPWTDGQISDGAKDFVRSLLQPDPARRPTSEALCENRWLHDTAVSARSTAGAISLAETSADVMKNLLQFSRISHFRKICICIIAQQLDHQHLQSLQRIFRQLDTSGDGLISLKEARDGFSKILGDSSCQGWHIDDVFSAIDLDGSGTIDYTEFCAAGLGQRVSLQEQALWAAFRSLGNTAVEGKLTCDDLANLLMEADSAHAFSAHSCSEVAHELMRQWDKNDDGCIDFSEFQRLMTDDGGEAAAAVAAAVTVPAVVSADGSAPSLGQPGCQLRGQSQLRARSRSRSSRRAEIDSVRSPQKTKSETDAVD